jgi:hypothetical protein
MARTTAYCALKARKFVSAEEVEHFPVGVLMATILFQVLREPIASYHSSSATGLYGTTRRPPRWRDGPGMLDRGEGLETMRGHTDQSHSCGPASWGHTTPAGREAPAQGHVKDHAPESRRWRKNFFHPASLPPHRCPRGIGRIILTGTGPRCGPRAWGDTAATAAGARAGALRVARLSDI